MEVPLNHPFKWLIMINIGKNSGDFNDYTKKSFHSHGGTPRIGDFKMIHSDLYGIYSISNG